MKLRFEVQILSVMLCYFNHMSIAADQDNRNSDKTSKKVDTKDITGASGNLYRVLMHQHIDEEKIEEGDDVNVKHNNFRMWNIQSRGFFHETQNCMNLTLQMDSIVSTEKLLQFNPIQGVFNSPPIYCKSALRPSKWPPYTPKFLPPSI